MQPSSPYRFELHLDPRLEISAVDLLSEHCDLSRVGIKRALLNGAGWLTRGKQTCRLRRAKKVIRPGETLHFYFDRDIQSQTPPQPSLIEDQKSYSIWYKPAGMFSQGSKWGDHCALYRWVEMHDEAGRPCYPVHRLDRATSGIMLLAHGKSVAGQLSEQFHLRKVRKQYQAIVTGTPSDSALLDSPIDGKQARSHYRLKEQLGGFSLLEVDIETGRKHQIRRHLSEAGIPIVGDRLYGGSLVPGQGLQLVAVSLGFVCPVAQREKIVTVDHACLPQLARLTE